MKKALVIIMVTISLIMAASAAVNAEVIEEEIIQEETPEEYEWYTDPANEDTWWAGIIRGILSVFPKSEEIEVL